MKKKFLTWAFGMVLIAITLSGCESTEKICVESGYGPKACWYPVHTNNQTLSTNAP